MTPIAGLQGVVLIGITDPVTTLPHLQRGTYYFLTRDVSGRFNGKAVHSNCSPVNALGQPNPLTANLVSLSLLLDPAFTEINCDPAAYPLGDGRRGRFLLDVQEQALVRARVAALNDVIAQAAQQNGWTFVDPNTLFGNLLSQTDAQGRYQNIRKCQLLPSASTATQLQFAVLNSCPVTGTTAAPNHFGSAISFDGIHPSAALHIQLAAEIALALQQ
jgi:hypothetical protein